METETTLTQLSPLTRRELRTLRDKTMDLRTLAEEIQYAVDHVKSWETLPGTEESARVADIWHMLLMLATRSEHVAKWLHISNAADDVGAEE